MGKLHHVINERRNQLITRLKNLLMIHKISELVLKAIKDLTIDDSNDDFISEIRKTFEHVTVAANLIGDDVEGFIVNKLNFQVINIPNDSQTGDTNDVLAEKMFGLVINDGFNQIRKLIIKINIEQAELETNFTKAVQKFKEILKKDSKNKNQITIQINTKINSMLKDVYPKGGADLINDLEKFDIDKIKNIFNSCGISLIQMLVQCELFSKQVVEELDTQTDSVKTILSKIARDLLTIDKKTVSFNNYAQRAKETMGEYALITPLKNASAMGDMLASALEKNKSLELQFESVRDALAKNCGEDLKLIFDEIVEAWAQKIAFDKSRRDKIAANSSPSMEKKSKNLVDISNEHNKNDEVACKRVDELLKILEPHLEIIVANFKINSDKKNDDMTFFKERLTHFAETKRLIGQISPAKLVDLYQANYLKRTKEFNDELNQLSQEAKDLAVEMSSSKSLSGKSAINFNRFSIAPLTVPTLDLAKRKNSTGIGSEMSPRDSSNLQSPREEKNLSSSVSPRVIDIESSNTSTPKKVAKFFKRTLSNAAALLPNKGRSNSTAPLKKSSNPKAVQVDIPNANQSPRAQSNTARFLQELEHIKEAQQQKSSESSGPVSMPVFSDKADKRMSRFVASMLDTEFTARDLKPKSTNREVADALTLESAVKTVKPKINFTGEVAKKHEFWETKAEAKSVSVAANNRSRAVSTPSKPVMISSQTEHKTIATLSIAHNPNSLIDTNAAKKTPPKPLPRPSKFTVSNGDNKGENSSKTSPPIPAKIINGDSNASSSSLSLTVTNTESKSSNTSPALGK